LVTKTFSRTVELAVHRRVDILATVDFKEESMAMAMPLPHSLPFSLSACPPACLPAFLIAVLPQFPSFCLFACLLGPSLAYLSCLFVVPGVSTPLATAAAAAPI